MIPAVVAKWQEEEALRGTQPDPGVPTTFEYMLYDTMYEWKMSPPDFEKLHPNYQAYMMAYIVSRRAREAYITDWYEKYYKDKNK